MIAAIIARSRGWVPEGSSQLGRLGWTVTIIAAAYLGLMPINIVLPTGLDSPRAFLNLDWITLVVMVVIAVVGAVFFLIRRPDRGASPATSTTSWSRQAQNARTEPGYSRRLVFAAIVDIPANVGYSLVFALIAVETMGIPVPGETALIAAALLAHDGEMNIVPLIALAAAAAIIGDNVGFAIGRKGGRRLFLMPGPFHHHRLAALDVGEPFFKRHGPKAVFLGRWVAGLRIASAWLAGMNKMDWPTFLFWNALGGIAWATSIGLGVYFVGHAFEKVLGVGGIVAAGVVSGALVGVFVWRRVRARRLGEADVPEPEREAEHAQSGH